MATVKEIRNPVEWSADLVVDMVRLLGNVGHALRLSPWTQRLTRIREKRPPDRPPTFLVNKNESVKPF